MKLSVSIVTFQESGYIRQAAESVLAQQTRFPFELIIGDDASTDGTRGILEDIRSEWPDQVRLLLASTNYGDRGLSNFMATIDACRGEYVAFLDGDDYWSSIHKLQRQVDFLDAHPECDLCGHRVDHLSDDGFRERSKLPLSNTGHTEGSHDIGELLIENFAHKISTVVRRSAIKALPAWYRTTPIASADWVFNVLIGRNGKVGFINDSMAVHRKRVGNLSAHYGVSRLLHDKLLALHQLQPYLPDHKEAIALAARRIRWKLLVARMGPRAYRIAQRLYCSPRSVESASSTEVVYQPVRQWPSGHP